MSNGEGRDSFGRSDLILLMESYRNTFESNTILLEQQKHLIEQWKALVDEQKATTQALNKIVDKINESIETVKTYHSLVAGEGEKLKGKVNLLYVGIGAIIIPLFAFVLKITTHLDLLEDIANYLSKVAGV